MESAIKTNPFYRGPWNFSIDAGENFNPQFHFTLCDRDLYLSNKIHSPERESSGK